MCCAPPPLPPASLQEVKDCSENGMISFDAFLRIVTLENKAIVQELTVRGRATTPYSPHIGPWRSPLPPCPPRPIAMWLWSLSMECTRGRDMPPLEPVVCARTPPTAPPSCLTTTRPPLCSRKKR